MRIKILQNRPTCLVVQIIGKSLPRGVAIRPDGLGSYPFAIQKSAIECVGLRIVSVKRPAHIRTMVRRVWHRIVHGVPTQTFGNWESPTAYKRAR